ncbi:MAG: hypothetical protein SVR04_13590 [Spirochaetota bacterium]|nr:hypothetical protein [Spirochaetota bacterium]
MGELMGFLKYERKDPGYRDVRERLEDYREVMQRPDAAAHPGPAAA